MTAKIVRRESNAPIAGDRLLGIQNVADILGTNTDTASRVIGESNRGIRCHRKLYILESELFAHLKEMEGGCNV